VGFITFFHAVLIVPVCSSFIHTVSAICIRGCLLDSLLTYKVTTIIWRGSISNRPQNIGRLLPINNAKKHQNYTEL